MEKTKEKEGLKFLARLRLSDAGSLNKPLRRKDRRGFVPKSAVTKQWKETIWAAQLEQLGLEWTDKIQVESKHPRRRLEVVRKCKKKLDHDNFVGGLKQLIDGLKSTGIKVGGMAVARDPGWFYDDSETYLELVASQEVTGEKAYLELTLYGQVERKRQEDRFREV